MSNSDSVNNALHWGSTSSLRVLRPELNIENMIVVHSKLDSFLMNLEQMYDISNFLICLMISYSLWWSLWGVPKCPCLGLSLALSDWILTAIELD